MGHTPAPERIDGNDAVLDLLLGLVDAVIGEEAFLLVGHSYGGYLARVIANAVLDRAGHGLPHEQVGLLAALLAEWLDWVDEHRAVVAAA
jgi:surfactin synthase thioesterase subunit